MKIYQSPYTISSIEDIYSIYDKEENKIYSLIEYTNLSEILVTMNSSTKEFVDFIGDKRGMFILPIEHIGDFVYYNNINGLWEILKPTMKSFFKLPVYLIVF